MFSSEASLPARSHTDALGVLSVFYFVLVLPQFFFLDAADTTAREDDSTEDDDADVDHIHRSSSDLSLASSHSHPPQDKSSPLPSSSSSDEANPLPPLPLLLKKKKKDLYGTLLRNFTHMRKIPSADLDYGDYAVVNVAPSVVPNPYLPSFRIFAFNISGEAYVPADIGVGMCAFLCTMRVLRLA